ncbi:T9SS type A sorting domain-containing protein [candidate division KSB1 bacterium]|nr:T9SS type A sorting domain-containing protein [candidate division KSB1 bacterium]
MNIKLFILHFFLCTILSFNHAFSQDYVSPQFIPDFKVNECTGEYGVDQYLFSAIDNGKGIVALIWPDERNGNLDFFVQGFAIDGTALGDIFKVRDNLIGESDFVERIILYGPLLVGPPPSAINANVILAVAWDVSSASEADSSRIADIYLQLFDLVKNERMHPSNKMLKMINGRLNNISITDENELTIWWTDYRNGKSNPSFYLQKYSIESPEPLSPEIQIVEINIPEGIYYSPSLIIEHDKRFWIWEEDGNVKATIASLRTAEIDTTFFINQTHNKVTDFSYSSFSFSQAPDGNFIVYWKSGENYWVQRFLPDGTRIGDNFMIKNCGNILMLKIDDNGKFIRLWKEPPALYLQRYSNDGNAIGEPLKVCEINDGSFPPSQRFIFTPQLLQDEIGNLIILWMKLHDDGRKDIYAKCFSSDIYPRGDEFQIVKETGTAHQYNPSIAVAENGRFMVAWMDNRDYFTCIYTKLYQKDGSVLKTDLLVNDDPQPYKHLNPDVTTDGMGYFLITWLWNCSQVYVQRYSNNGTPIQENIKVSEKDIAFTGYNSPHPSIAADEAGNFMVVWDRGYYDGVYGQGFLLNGTPVGNNFLISDLGYTPVICYVKNRGFLIVWRSGSEICYAQFFQIDGTPMGTPVPINENPIDTFLTYLNVACSDNGYAIISWNSGDYESGHNIDARLIDANLIPVGPTFRVNNSPGSVLNPSVAIDQQGNFIIAWTNQKEYRIYAQKYLPDGRSSGKNFVLPDNTGSTQLWPDIALLNDKIYAAWTDNRNGGTGFDVWAKLVDLNITAIPETKPDEPPTHFSLHQNYPNPFNPATTITFSLAEDEFTQILIYNIRGELVRTLAEEKKAPGKYSLVWDGRDNNGCSLSSGIYFIQMHAGDFHSSQKALMLK